MVIHAWTQSTLWIGLEVRMSADAAHPDSEDQGLSAARDRPRR